MSQGNVEVLCEHVISGKCKRHDCAAAKRNSVGIANCVRTEKGMLAYGFNCNHQGDVLLLADKIDNPNHLFAIKKRKLDW